MRRNLKAIAGTTVAILGAVTLTGCGQLPLDAVGKDPLTTSAPSSEQMVAEAKTALPTMKTLEKRPSPGGYERSCGDGKGCVFGPRWTDDQDAPMGHNGCDTRNDVLGSQLSKVQYKKGSDCVVTSGTYTEPYFGSQEEFVKGEPQKTQDEIDHVLPLALAWDLGMSEMPIDQRAALANDAEYNLLVSTNAANASGHDVNGDGKYQASRGEYPGKSDMAAHEWLPYLTDTGRACDYSARYVLVADRYGLPILAADKKAIEGAFSRC